MIVYRFELQNDRGERETVDACGHSKYDMWHDLAEKVASLDRQADYPPGLLERYNLSQVRYERRYCHPYPTGCQL